MKRLMCSALAVLSLAAGAQTIPLAATSDGAFTGSFVQEADGTILDTFTFAPTAVTGRVTVELTDLSGPINFFTAILNGQGFSFLPESGSTAFYFTTTVTADQPLQLLVTGFAGDATTLDAMGATYGGSISISAVPEPTTLALMLAGLGLAGMAARRRSKASLAGGRLCPDIAARDRATRASICRCST